MLDHRKRKILGRRKYVEEKKRRFEKTATVSLYTPCQAQYMVLTPAQLTFFS